MKATTRDQFNAFGMPATAASAVFSNSNPRLSGVRQALTALRDEDPAFDKSVTTQRYERGATVASPDALSRAHVRTDERQGQLDLHE